MGFGKNTVVRQKALIENLKKVHSSEKCGKMEVRWNVMPEVSKSLTQYLNLLDDTLTHQQEIMEQLEQCVNHQLLANLIVSTVPGASADKFTLAVQTLEADLAAAGAAGVLLAEYDTAIAGFRQWAFPFSSILLDSISFQLPALLKNKLALENLANAAVQDITALKNKVDTQDTTMTTIKKYVRSSTSLAVSPRKEDGSLLVWRGQDHAATIRALLRGEETPLLGAVEAALQGDGLDAVKVAEVQLYLAAPSDPQLQRKLDDAMEAASVDLIHSGVHHFRCGRRLFRIVTPPLEVTYGVRRDTTGMPIKANDVYRTLARVQPVLSPFTTWVARVSGGGATLRGLETEASRVDLHLLARVSYVHGFACPDSLGSSYQEDQCPAGQPSGRVPSLAKDFLHPLVLYSDGQRNSFP